MTKEIERFNTKVCMVCNSFESDGKQTCRVLCEDCIDSAYLEYDNEIPLAPGDVILCSASDKKLSLVGVFIKKLGADMPGDDPNMIQLKKWNKNNNTKNVIYEKNLMTDVDRLIAAKQFFNLMLKGHFIPKMKEISGNAEEQGKYAYRMNMQLWDFGMIFGNLSAKVFQEYANASGSVPKNFVNCDIEKMLQKSQNVRNIPVNKNRFYDYVPKFILDSFSKQRDLIGEICDDVCDCCDDVRKMPKKSDKTKQTTLDDWEEYNGGFCKKTYLTERSGEIVLEHMERVLPYSMNNFGDGGTNTGKPSDKRTLYEF